MLGFADFPRGWARHRRVNARDGTKCISMAPALHSNCLQ